MDPTKKALLKEIRAYFKKVPPTPEDRNSGLADLRAERDVAIQMLLLTEEGKRQTAENILAKIKRAITDYKDGDKRDGKEEAQPANMGAGCEKKAVGDRETQGQAGSIA